MKQSYPELETGFDRISQIAYAEEEAFRRTLAAGTTILDTAVTATKCGRVGGDAAAGDQAFQLHDTYGFPIDLTLEMAAEQGLEVDREGFTPAHDGAARAGQGRREGQEGRPREHRRCGVTCARSGRPTVRAYQRADHRGDRRRPRRRRRARSRSSSPASAARSCSTAPRSTPSPAARSPTRASSPPTARSCGSSTSSGRSRASSRTPSRCSPGPVRSGAGRAGRGRPRVAARRRARRTPAPTSCTRRCARCSARRRCSPAPTTSPATCGSTSRGARPSSAATRSEIEEVANLAVRQDLPVSATYMTAAARPASSARWRCSARRTTRRCASSRSAAPGRASCAVAPTCGTPRQIGALHGHRASRRSGSGVRRVEAFVGIDALRYLAKERALVAELTELVKVRSRASSRSGSARCVAAAQGRRARARPGCAASRCRRRPATSSSTPATSTA